MDKKETKETKKIKAVKAKKVIITVDLDGPSIIEVSEPKKKPYKPVDFLGF